MNKPNKFFCGIVIGIINAAMGAGGGIIAVPILKKNGMTQKEAQANALAIIFPITIISLIIYFKKGYVNFIDLKNILPFAVIGSIIGTFIFAKLKDKFLSIIFSLFMIWAGVRLFTK